MPNSTIIILLICTILFFLINFGSVFFLVFQKQFHFKSFLLGILVYFINRGFIFPLLLSVSNSIVPQLSFLSTIFILSFTCIIIKQIIFSRFMRHNLNNYICGGLGEAFFELSASLFPILLNALMYSIKIQNNTLFTFFENTHTHVEIQSIIDTFLNIPNTYYISLILLSCSIIFMQIVVSYLLYKKTNFFIIFIFTLTLYFINYIMPTFSYLLHIVLIIMLGLIFYFSRKRLFAQ